MILVTGGAGFIGSNLVASLNEGGVTDIVVSEVLDNAPERWRNLAKREIHDLVAADDLPAWLARHGAQVRAVVHLGAISSTQVNDLAAVTRHNIRCTLDLWEWCTAADVPFYYASSAATYGAVGERTSDGDDGPDALARLRPTSLYGWSKHVVDRRVARDAADGRGPRRWAALKFFNVYGPNEAHKGGQQSLVPQFVAQIRARAEVGLFRSNDPRFPDGGQRRDFVWVGDCVDVIRWLLDGDRPLGGVFDVGTGVPRTFADLARITSAACARPLHVRYVDIPEGLAGQYQNHTRALLPALRHAGYDRAFLPLEEGVHRYLEQYLFQPDPYR